MPDLLLQSFVYRRRAGLARYKFEEPVVEPDYLFETAPVGVHCLADGCRELPLDLLAEQGPVGVAETVDALLDVAYDEVAAALGLAFPQQRKEVGPLHGRGVLEFVQQEVIVPDAEFFVYEWGVGVVYDAFEYVCGVIQRQDVLFREQLVVVFQNLSVQAETVDV